jgi:hypothetical protein
MISHQATSPTDACSPDADRAGPAMPANIARLLTVVRILLQFGRHLAATMERRAAGPGFWLFSAVFGTTKLPIISAHLHRGILRAAALESLLLARAATGRDLAVEQPRTDAAPDTTGANDAPSNEPFAAQVARLAAERARHDAPVDPDHLSARETIEAEVGRDPISRTIAAICRDLGIIAMMCTRELWASAMEAIACHHDIPAARLEDTQPAPQESRHAPENESHPEQMRRSETIHPRRTSALTISHRPAGAFRHQPAPTRPRQHVAAPHKYLAAAPAATGPPPRVAMKFAA